LPGPARGIIASSYAFALGVASVVADETQKAFVQNCGKGGPNAVAKVRPLAGDRAGCAV